MDAVYLQYSNSDKQKINDMTTQEMQIEAKRLQEKGSPLTIEKIIKILEKREAKKGKVSKKSAKGFERRSKYENMEVKGNCFHNLEEMNRQTSLNCRPSSMR